MKLIILKSKSPYLNLAIEEYMFSYCEDDVFMLWQNEPTVVIGKNQNAFAEINVDYVKENGIHVARRITGGGAVFHDLGNVNYTFIANRKGREGIDFEYFCTPIIEALADMGIKSSLSGRNDILIEDKKISGNAQHSKGERVLHHGTILFDSNLDLLDSALKVDEEKIKAKAIKSTRSRVTNIKEYLKSDIKVSEFIDKISEFVTKKYSATLIEAPKSEIINELEIRNTSSKWIYPERDYLSHYKITKKKKFDFALIELFMDMKNDVISDVRIVGDFFGKKEISELEDMIKGRRLSELDEVITDVILPDYIYGITASDLIEFIK